MRLFSQNVKIEALKRAPLFEGLSKKELAKLARITDDLRVEPGTVLCREGKAGREFFVIVDGEAQVTKGGEPVLTLRGGEFVGEIALVKTTKRTATVKAITPLRCFILTQGDFRRVLEENPSVQHKIMQALAERLSADTDL